MPASSSLSSQRYQNDRIEEKQENYKNNQREELYMRTG